MNTCKILKSIKLPKKSPVSKFRTYESVPSGSPRNVLASLDGPRSVIVKWEPVHASQASGIILGYTVRVAPGIAHFQYDEKIVKVSEREGQAQEETKTVDAPDHDMHSVKVTGLRAYSGYRVFVSAYTIVGNGPENTVATLVDTGEDREPFLRDFRFQNYLSLNF